MNLQTKIGLWITVLKPNTMKKIREFQKRGAKIPNKRIKKILTKQFSQLMDYGV